MVGYDFKEIEAKAIQGGFNLNAEQVHEVGQRLPEYNGGIEATLTSLENVYGSDIFGRRNLD